ncbi:MAG: ATP-binding protein [Thalassobaculum sp.]|uniref:ATP-binding protein n=1 Tax=Thalassobaculum sp. TaxID=2022740 RepID=UPI0032ED9AB9
MKIRTKAGVLGGITVVAAAALILVTISVLSRLYDVSARLDQVNLTLHNVRAADTLATEFLLTQSERALKQWDRLRIKVEDNISGLSEALILPNGARTELVIRLHSMQQTIEKLQSTSAPIDSPLSKILMTRLNANRNALTARVEALEVQLEAERGRLLNTTAILILATVVMSSLLVTASSYQLFKTFLGAFDEISQAVGQLRPGQPSSKIRTARRDEVGGLLVQIEAARESMDSVFAAETDARQKAEELSSAKTAFIATISHELRTPLNGLLGSIRILTGSELSGKQARYLSMAETSGENLLAIVNDVLDFTKIESGRLEVERMAFHPMRILQDVRSMFVSLAEQKGLRFDSTIDLPDDLQLLGDPTRITQILNNLLSNAVKFTAAGTVTIRARVAETDGSGPTTLTVEVIDTGIGIPADKLKHVFEAFSQADETTTRKYGGSGLGLAICAKLAAVMGGELALDSAEGQGTTFTLTLPLPISTDDARTVQRERVSDDDTALAGLRVLLVDDVDLNRMIASEVLEHWGCTVSEARDGREAVDMFSAGHFDVVLMDVQMPEMDGVEATRLIRRSDRLTPIIGMTANAFSEQRGEYLQAGMTDVMPKPVVWDDLHARLTRHRAQVTASV